MKVSIRRCSLGGTQSSALKPPSAVSPGGTWPAILAGRSETSNDWIARIPHRPAIRRSQFTPTPQPSGDTSPMPVTTTRLIPYSRDDRAQTSVGGQPLADRILDVVDGILHGENLLRGLVGYLDPEFFLERHHQLDGIQAVCPEIVDEARILDHLPILDTEMFDDDLFHPLGDVIHRFYP